MDEIKQTAEEISKEAINLRHAIHANPEIALKEEKTADLVEKELINAGIKTKRLISTGVLGLLEGNLPGKTLAIRADMDALNITEETDCVFSSEIEGMMHACGHDVHTSVLLGVAKVLSRFRDNIKGNVKFIFQPAEENGPTGGAAPMIEEGVLSDPEPDLVLGLHVSPEVDLGKIAIRKGVMTSNSDRVFIEIKGKQCHGSTPHAGIDALVTACHIVTAVQTIISRNLDPRMTGALTLGTIQGGQRYDTVSEKVKIEGTCRTFNDVSRKMIPERLNSLCTDIASAFGAQAKVNYLYGYPSVINDSEPVDLVVKAGKEALGDNKVEILDFPVMFAEDFSYFIQDIPGAFFLLGVSDQNSGHYPLHNPKFLPSDDCILNGIEIFSRAAISYLS